MANTVKINQQALQLLNIAMFVILPLLLISAEAKEILFSGVRTPGPSAIGGPTAKLRNRRIDTQRIMQGPLTLVNGKLTSVNNEPATRDDKFSPASDLNPFSSFEPKIHITKLPQSESYDSQPSTSFERGNTKNDKKDIVLDTKYFSLTYPDIELQKYDPSTTTTLVPAKPTFSSDAKPNLVLRKVKGKMKTTTAEPPAASSVDNLCDKTIECTKKANKFNGSNTRSEIKLEYPTYQQFINNFRQEVWVVPILIASISLLLILFIFEMYLLAKAVNRNPSRRHLFLGQMLLFGLVSCTGVAVVFTLKPTVISCAVIRLGSGLSYSLIYSTLLVKLVFLVSLNSGVYLPATYQSLLLCFAVLIQLVIGVQWLVTAPPELILNESGIETETTMICLTTFKQQLFGLLYVVFLIIVVVLLAFKARGVRENYREAIYVGLTMGFTVAIWIVWVLAALIVPLQYKDACSACGLIACTSITFVIMFMPKGRQLSAMGKEGLYAEDRTAVYTGSGTGSTGSSGTPSPSFFPVKTGNQKLQADIAVREKLETPNSMHRKMQIFGGRIESHRGNFQEKFPDEEIFENDDHFLRQSSQRRRSQHHRPSHLVGHPLFRASQGDLTRDNLREGHRSFSHRDLTREEKFFSRSDPTYSSRRRTTDGNRSKEILATISPRRIPSCRRCLPTGYLPRQEESIYDSFRRSNFVRMSHTSSKPSRSNPNVMFRRPNDMPQHIIY